MKKTTTAKLLVVFLASSFSIAAAHADDASAIKHRQGVMQGIGGHFAATLATLGGPEEFKPNHKLHATTIAQLAKIAPKLFTAESSKGKTKAKSDIWENRQDFNSKMDDFVAQADVLAAASQKDDFKAYVNAAKGLGKTCKACHREYKKK